MTQEVFLWNRAIRGCGRGEAAARTYGEMRRLGLRPDGHTLPFLLRSLTRQPAARLGPGLHAQAIKFGLASDAHAEGALIRAYCLSGRVAAARAVFDRSRSPDLVMWNSIIAGYNRARQFAQACELLEKMSLPPSRVTFLLALSACRGHLKRLAVGQSLHRRMELARLVPGDLALENALIAMYAECGDSAAALKVFDGMAVRDVISWTSAIKALADDGQLDRARSLFEETPERDLVCWTAMIDGYVKGSRFKEALALFCRMQTAGVRPDAFAVAGALTACAHLGALEAGEWVRVFVARTRIRTDVAVANALVDMYSKCGAIDKAWEVFAGMDRRDERSWAAMITGLAVNGCGEEALDLFDEMLRRGDKPDGVIILGALQACAHAGLVERGRRLFSEMRLSHGVAPEMAHYGCLVDMLGRAGLLREALEVLESMPMEPNSVVLGALLGACRLHSDTEMAETAAAWLRELEPRGPAADALLLASAYGSCGQWEQVRRVKQRAMEESVRKTPGCSLIEVEGEVREFVAGDATHPRCAEIVSMAAEMGRQLPMAAG
ncbi:putative pentatricopeptide repeat-containing protein At3g15930 [Wolffia australiana]